MKKFWKAVLFCLIVLTMFALSACAGAKDDGGYSSGGGSEGGVSPGGIGVYPTGKKTLIDSETGLVVDSAVRGDADVEGVPAKDTDAGDETVDSSEEANEINRAGLITASAWDDNQYYSAYTDLFVKGQTEDEDGKFVRFVDGKWWFDTTDRVKVTVKEGENPVVGAAVTYYDEEQNALTAVTNAKGEAFLFPNAESGTLHIKSGENETTAEFSAEERDLAVELVSGRAKDNVIKLMFVVDVTGSMGDDLDYVKVELADVIRRVAQANDGVRIDLALLFYRDDGDDEKFAYAEFKTVSNNETTLAEQMAFLKNQYASGGGDYEEAVDEAIEMAVGKNWGEENSTKMIFFVLDAPPHSNEKNITRCGHATADAAA